MTAGCCAQYANPARCALLLSRLLLDQGLALRHALDQLLGHLVEVQLKLSHLANATDADALRVVSIREPRGSIHQPVYAPHHPARCHQPEDAANRQG